MEFIKRVALVDGKKTFYWEKNPSQKEVMVFLHGFPGNHAGLLDLAKSFKKEYRIIIPDMPACGLSDPLTKIHNLEHYAQWLDDFLETMAIGNVILAGHSFGSRVALSFARMHPEKVGKLVLITPVSRVDGLIVRIASLVKGDVAKVLPESLRKRWLSNSLYQKVVNMIVFKSASPQRRAQIAKMDRQELKNLDVRATMELFDEFNKYSLIPLAGSVASECLVIAGDKDEIATLRSVEELKNQLSDALLWVVKDAGHLLPLEEPENTAGIIESWLNT